MSARVLHGDCLEVMRDLDEASIDAVVTDPPYGLEFMSVAWDTFSDRAKGRPRPRNEWGDFGSREHARHPSEVAKIQRKKGLAFQRFCGGWAREVYRVLKPGGHLLAFGGSRTYHRMACAVEDSGFEIRDQIMWLYGQGFPKSLDVSKAIDKAVGAEREVVGRAVYGDGHVQNSAESMGYGGCDPLADQRLITAPATDAAKRWAGWGTALKPAHEPILVARKPLSEPNVAANVLRWGVGALNINACRAPTDEDLNGGAYSFGAKRREDASSFYLGTQAGEYRQPSGRWPANVCWSVPEDEYLLKSDVTAEQKRELYRWLHENA